jgi:hypothetical protein
MIVIGSASSAERTAMGQDQRRSPLVRGLPAADQPRDPTHPVDSRNNHVGTEYSALIRTRRLIDKDPFSVEVTQ